MASMAGAEDLEQTIAGIRQALQAVNASKAQSAKLSNTDAAQQPARDLEHASRPASAATRGAPPTPAAARGTPHKPRAPNLKGQDQLDRDIERLRQEKKQLEHDIAQTERRNLSRGGRSRSSAGSLDRSASSASSQDDVLFAARSLTRARPPAHFQKQNAKYDQAGSLSLSGLELPVSSMIPQAPLSTGTASARPPPSLLDTRRSLPSVPTWDERADHELKAYPAYLPNGHEKENRLLAPDNQKAQRSAPMIGRLSGRDSFGGELDFMQQSQNADMIAIESAWEHTAPHWATSERQTRGRSLRHTDSTISAADSVDAKYLFVENSSRDTDTIPLMTIHDENAPPATAYTTGARADRPANSEPQTSASAIEDSTSKKIWELVPGRQSAPDISGGYGDYGYSERLDEGSVNGDEMVYSDYGGTYSLRDLQTNPQARRDQDEGIQGSFPKLVAPKLLQRVQEDPRATTGHDTKSSQRETPRSMRSAPVASSFAQSASPVPHSGASQPSDEKLADAMSLVTCTSLFEPAATEEPEPVPPEHDQTTGWNQEWSVQADLAGEGDRLAMEISRRMEEAARQKRESFSMRGRRSFQSPGHSQLTRVDEDVEGEREEEQEELIERYLALGSPSTGPVAISEYGSPATAAQPEQPLSPMVEPATAPRAVREAPPLPPPAMTRGESDSAQGKLAQAVPVPRPTDDYAMLCQRHDRHEQELDEQIQRHLYQPQLEQQRERELEHHRCLQLELEENRQREEREREEQQQLLEDRRRGEREVKQIEQDREREFAVQCELHEQVQREAEKRIEMEHQHREEEQRRIEKQQKPCDRNRQEEEQRLESRQSRLGDPQVKSVVTNVRASELVISSPDSAAPPEIRPPISKLVRVTLAGSGASLNGKAEQTGADGIAGQALDCSQAEELAENLAALPERPRLSPPPSQPSSAQPKSGEQTLLHLAANQLVVESDSDDGDDEVHCTPRIAREAKRHGIQPSMAQLPPLSVLDAFPSYAGRMAGDMSHDRSLIDDGAVDGSDEANSIGAAMPTAMPDAPSPPVTRHRQMQSVLPSLAMPTPPDSAGNDQEAGAPSSPGPPVMLDQEITDDLFLKAMGFSDSAHDTGSLNYVAEAEAATRKPRTAAFTVAHLRAEDPPLQKSSGLLPVISSIFGLGAGQDSSEHKPSGLLPPARPPQGLVPQVRRDQSIGMAEVVRNRNSDSNGLHQEFPLEMHAPSVDGEQPCYSL